MGNKKHYAERDIIEQGEHYTNHVMALTAEGLHGKSEIAAELAHRDQRIAALEAENDELRDKLEAAEALIEAYEDGSICADERSELIRKARKRYEEARGDG